MRESLEVLSSLAGSQRSQGGKWSKQLVDRQTGGEPPLLWTSLSPQNQNPTQKRTLRPLRAVVLISPIIMDQHDLQRRYVHHRGGSRQHTGGRGQKCESFHITNMYQYQYYLKVPVPFCTSLLKLSIFIYSIIHINQQHGTCRSSYDTVDQSTNSEGRPPVPSSIVTYSLSRLGPVTQFVISQFPFLESGSNNIYLTELL